jgi:hypothetical protein
VCFLGGTLFPDTRSENERTPYILEDYGPAYEDSLGKS